MDIVYEAERVAVSARGGDGDNQGGVSGKRKQLSEKELAKLLDAVDDSDFADDESD